MTADNGSAQDFVLAGKADLALLIEPPQSLVLEGITYERLYKIHYLAALPQRHRLIRKAVLNLADLSSEPLILGTPNTIARHVTTRSLAHDIGQVYVVAAYRSGRQLTNVLRALILQILLDNEAEED
jgi:hypothetical protein